MISLLWRPVLGHSEASDTSCAWWVYHWPDQPMCMATTCLSFTTHHDLNWHWRRKAILFAQLCFDPTYPDIDFDTFNDGAEWKTYYGDVTKAIPPNAPDLRGKYVDLRMWVDSDHAGDKVTRRLCTGHFIFLNTALINWLSKKQATIEGSVFGSDFIAMKTGFGALRGIRYILRMMGVPLTGPTYVYGDNMSVIYNTSRSELTLKKKSNSICYHAVREAVASGECLTMHCKTGDDYSDMMNKVLYV